MIEARAFQGRGDLTLAPPKSESAKRELGQFFTPPKLANFIASFFLRPLRAWRVIDAGAGAGALTLALLQRALKQHPLPVSFHVTAYEVDPEAVHRLHATLGVCERLCDEHGVTFSADLRTEDFIFHAVAALEQGLFASAPAFFNAAIVNPPYRKLSSGSSAHRRLHGIGIDVTNLYSAFLSLLSRLLEPHAELVAIVPRSFCNGPYFRAFRRDFLSRMALRRLHLFDSRTAAFSREAVLQENIVFRAERTSTPPPMVEISSSRGDFTDSVQSRLLPWTEVVHPRDPEAFIRLPSNESEYAARTSLGGLTDTLSELGLKVSTGKVVDFRVREHLRAEATPESYPLLYPCHFEQGVLNWPKLGSKKPNALSLAPGRTDLLIPAGYYVVVRRFSSKEERKRIVASLVDPARLPIHTLSIGLENHLNFYHRAGQGLPRSVAKGLMAYLNWSVVDAYFRHFNGHTQVNATDLRSLPYPSAKILAALGAKVGDALPSQAELDALVASHCSPLCPPKLSSP